MGFRTCRCEEGRHGHGLHPVYQAKNRGARLKISSIGAEIGVKNEPAVRERSRASFGRGTVQVNEPRSAWFRQVRGLDPAAVGRPRASACGGQRHGGYSPNWISAAGYIMASRNAGVKERARVSRTDEPHEELAAPAQLGSQRGIGSSRGA